MFLGREKEYKTLTSLKSSKCANFVVIKGRRRIGKSRLIREFSGGFSNKFLFAGLAPSEGVTADMQREEFVQQMVSQGLPNVKSTDWTEIFTALAKFVKKGPALIALDEISWMGSEDSAFLGKLKNAWERYFEKNPQLILIVASSISSWIEKNILKSTGFFGRVNLTLTLEELPLEDCVKFWGKRQKLVSAYEKLKILAVTGGIPKYLELMDPKISAEENIRRQCFLNSGYLFSEFERIFHDLFSKRSTTYGRIVEVLADYHSLAQEAISEKTGIQLGRVFSEYLTDLTEAGFISADFTWDIKTGKVGKLRKYRLSDNYLRFYLKYVAPNKQKILKGDFEDANPSKVMHWDAIMGLQFENLIIHNRKKLLKALNIFPENCTCDGPFFQTKTTTRKGCQVDYLIQEKNTLYVCEIKFSKNPIGTQVIKEVQKKIALLSLPKHVSCRPVLIHVGGVSEEVVYKDYFDQIVDWTLFIK